MTIVKLNTNNYKLIFSIIGLFLLFSLLIFAWILFYNESVSIRHELERGQASLRRVEVENAELKNNLYQLVDAGNLQEVALRQALVMEKNPEYSKVKQIADR